MEPAMTGGNTSPLLSDAMVSSRGLSRVQSVFGGTTTTTEIQKEVIARSLGAKGPRGESGSAGASGLAPGAGFSIASEVAAQGRSSGKRERRVHLGREECSRDRGVSC